MNDIEKMIADCKKAKEKEIAIGIGKIILYSDNPDDEFFNIPNLHFLLTKDESEKNPISAINLEFSLVAGGKTVDEAINRLLEMVVNFLHENISVYGFDCLAKIADDSSQTDWRTYRKLIFELAKQQKERKVQIKDEISNKNYDDLLVKYGIKATTKYNTFKEVA